MDFERFDNNLTSAFRSAQILALGLKHNYVTSLHLVKVLTSNDDQPASIALIALGVDMAKFRQDIEHHLDRLAKLSEITPSQMSISSDLAELFVQAEKAIVDSNSKLGVFEIMLAMTLINDQAIKTIFSEHKITAKKLKTAFKNSQDFGSEAKSAIEKYMIDLTALAKEGKIDPVIGREEEIRRVIHVISRRTKNNPVLIGEPGVGKTAIVEGLAIRILKGDVPQSLKNKRVLSLDLGSLLAGTKFRGEFEERLKEVLKSIEDQALGIICFIDEVHTLVGAGSVEGTLDASNMLKPALARGTLHCIGATTVEEYRKYIEKDQALARRFQPVWVEEAGIEESVSILRGLKDKYELHHGVAIKDSALVAAVELSSRYINDRFLPDKAIDLIDEAASKLKMEIDSKPEELDRIDRRLLLLKIEETALKKENDDESEQRLTKINKEISKLQRESDKITAEWESTRNKLESERELKIELEAANLEKDRAEQEGNLERASELSYSIIPKLQKQLAKAKSDSKKGEVINNNLDAVSAQDIAKIVSRWTSIPVDKMLKEEKQSLLRLEEDLRRSVVGQTEAVVAVAKAVRRTRAGIADPNKPIASFLFLGPTGVGKTELAKALANNLFDSNLALTRIDMSEYMEKQSVSRLIGAPPGYVGYEQGGTLTEKVRTKPYQILLFDEVEKAHPDVFNVFLQILDEGRLTDGKGRTVNFKNTIIILTSNIAAGLLTEVSIIDDKVRSDVLKQVQVSFKPEFINRLDEIIIFEKLSIDDMKRIVEIQIKSLDKILEGKKIKFSITEDAKLFLAKSGFDPIYGARPLKRLIQKTITDSIAEMILADKINHQQKIKIDLADDKVVLAAVDDKINI